MFTSARFIAILILIQSASGCKKKIVASCFFLCSQELIPSVHKGIFHMVQNTGARESASPANFDACQYQLHVAAKSRKSSPGKYQSCLSDYYFWIFTVEACPLFFNSFR